jgi:hypothetical protein
MLKKNLDILAHTEPLGLRYFFVKIVSLTFKDNDFRAQLCYLSLNVLSRIVLIY